MYALAVVLAAAAWGQPKLAPIAAPLSLPSLPVVVRPVASGVALPVAPLGLGSPILSWTPRIDGTAVAPAALPAARRDLAVAERILAGPELSAPSAWQTYFDGGVAQSMPALAASAPSVPLGPVFSEDTRISERLVRAIDGAETSIDVAIHGLSLPDVAQALGRAKTRGVAVRIVINQTHVHPEKATQSRSPEVQYLIVQGFEMRTLKGGGPYGTMHNKFAIFDGRLLETGSFNWSRAADERNHENALFTDDSHRIGGYREYWGWMWAQGKPVGREPAPGAPQVATPPVDAALPIRFGGGRFPAYAFSPKGGTQGWLVDAISRSKKSIELAMFSFTSQALEQALKDARARGVRVRIIFDKSQAGGLEPMRRLIRLGFDVRLSEGRGASRPGALAQAKGHGPENGVFHHKFALFDGELLETGSFNWTANGEENNFENANFFAAGAELDGFKAAFERRWGGASAPSSGEISGPTFLPEDFEIH